MSFTSRESQRVFHYTFTVALLVGTSTYFAQAADLGWNVEPAGQELPGQIFWAKYINWAIGFPSLALALGLLSGVSWTTIVTNLFICWLWVLNYLAAAYTTTDYKCGFFAIGTFVYVILAMSTLNESRESAQVIGITRDYVILSVWVNLLWLLYPIAFALSDGSGAISVTGGLVFFGVLDALLLPVTTFAFLGLSRNWDFARLDLDFSEYRGNGKGRIFPVTGQDVRAVSAT